MKIFIPIFIIFIIRESKVDKVNLKVYAEYNELYLKNFFYRWEQIKCTKKGKSSNSNKNLKVDQRVTLEALIYSTRKNFEEKSSNGKLIDYNFEIEY